MARSTLSCRRLALDVWGALERQPFHAAAIDGIGRFLGAEAKAAFAPAFSLNTAEELRRLANDAGLRNIRVRFEHRTFRYPVPAGLVIGWMGSTPVNAQFMALPDDRNRASSPTW
jgi:hypothetical protein